MALTRFKLPGRLQTRLTVLYASLFAGALVMVSIAVYIAVVGAAERSVRAELQSGGTVFDRLWDLRSSQLTDGASILARDFGFRAAFASGDGPTIESALDNLRQRLNVDRAYVISADGEVLAATGAADRAGAGAIAEALYDNEEAAGVIMLGRTPYQTVSAPIYSPTLVGWIVFAVKLDDDEMRALERLSSIPLKASVLHKSGASWISSAPASRRDQLRIDQFVDGAIGQVDARPGRLGLRGESAVALVKALPSMDQKAPAVLMLRYPLALAMAPYRALFAVMVLVGLGGLVVLIFGSWALARTLTRPIAALDNAAQRLQAGEDVEVPVQGDDEVSRLGRSFNQMAAEIRARERRITHMAMHDGDSALPNRRALEQALAAPAMSVGLGVAAACGIDRFAEIRGAIGYALSARLIAEVARRLEQTGLCAGVGRLASDAVGAVFAADDLETARAVAERLARAMEAPVILDGASIDIALTAGLAAMPLHGETPAQVFDRASIAVDQARAARARWAVFDENAYGDPARNLSLMSELRSAIGDGGLSVHYQPKLDLRSGDIVGAEALVRWRHPERGPLSPDLFVAMAEETGHIRDLTEFVLTRAIADQAALAAAGHALKMSVNISGRLVGDPAFARWALDMARKTPGPLCFEITETAVIDNEDSAGALLDALAAAGVEISIDDYGSGLSSLAYLKRIPARELKIDKAFVLSMTAEPRDALLVRSTIDLAHSLGMHVTAEGVENDAIMNLLRIMGCDLAQGFGIAKPMPINNLLGFLDEKTSQRHEPAKVSGLAETCDPVPGDQPGERRTGLRPA